MYSLFNVAALSAVTYAYSGNSTPIYGTYPGWLEGSNSKNIQIELFEDYLCSDCKALNPVFEEFLDTAFLDGTVRDAVTVGLTPFPLPYHVHTYQVNQLVSYFMDLCVSGKGCYSNEYKDFAYEQ